MYLNSIPLLSVNGSLLLRQHIHTHTYIRLWKYIDFPISSFYFLLESNPLDGNKREMVRVGDLGVKVKVNGVHWSWMATFVCSLYHFAWERDLESLVDKYSLYPCLGQELMVCDWAEIRVINHATLQDVCHLWVSGRWKKRGSERIKGCLYRNGDWWLSWCSWQHCYSYQ